MDFYILYVVSRLSPSADLLEEVNFTQQHLQTKYLTLDQAGDQVHFCTHGPQSRRSV